MCARDYTRLLAELREAYAQHSPASRALQERALHHQVDGGSHTLRLIPPFPPRIKAAHGAYLWDEDGHRIQDTWLGHLADILGHNPPEITTVLAQGFAEGFGLQTGFTDQLQIEVAELLCSRTGAERVRFTTSGALATMYSIMLSCAYTGRSLVMKVGGGWHGAQPWALKGINFHTADGSGLHAVESEGVPNTVAERVLVTPFNDSQQLREQFRCHGDQIACFIVEPFLGVSGFVPATREFLETAREVTQQYGAVLILDEVIDGFRFRAGNLGALYGMQPDLTTFGKIIGGGMPVAAVAGRADILELAGRGTGPRVRFSGGTYSAHPASMLAAKTMMAHLVAHEAEIYPRLAKLGERVRSVLLKVFQEEGVPVFMTGHDAKVLSGSSFWMLHFPFREDARLSGPGDWLDPAVCDMELEHKVLDLALLLEDVFVLHSHGAVSTAHAEADIDAMGDACRRAVRRIKPYL